MIEDIIFDSIQYFELQTDNIGIYHPISILFGDVGSIDIVKTETITII